MRWIYLSSIFFFWGNPAGALSKEEPYSVRPMIENVAAVAHDHDIKNEDWANTKVAFLRYLASLNFYSESTHFYFLARDFEVAYDLARILYQGSAILDRIHLLNVSRASLKDPNLWEYLEQQGINDRDPKRQHLLLDSGMLGTIPDFIRKTAPKNLRPKIMASQLLSANSKYPSSRVYLSTLEAMAVKGAVSRWESIILLFENIPHFTNTCQKYQQSENGDWIAITGPKYKTPEMGMGALGGFGFGGALLEEFEPKDPKGALAYMQDTRAFAESSEVQEEFARLSGVWLSVRKALEAAKKANNPKLFDESLESILKRSKLSELLTVAIAKDAKEAVRKLMPFRAKSARNSGSCQKSL